MSSTGLETTSEVATSPKSVPYLDYLEKKIQEEKADEFRGEAWPYEIVRDLLTAPDNDDHAIENAVSRFQQVYIAAFDESNFRRPEPPEYDAALYLNSLSHAVFETVNYLVFSDVEHERLAQLLVAIKRSAASEFDEQVPQFVYHYWGLGEAIDTGRTLCTSGWTKDRGDETAAYQANLWVSVSALVAKIVHAGLPNNGDGPNWFFADFNEAFYESRSKYDLSTNIGRQAEVMVPVNDILIAGEQFVEEVKKPSRKYWFELSKEKWKLWASKLQEVANEVGEDAPWGMKQRAQAAHDKMVELYPEAFSEDVQNET